MKRRFTRSLLAIMVAYSALVGLVGCVQRKLLYFPPRVGAAELQPYVDQAGLRPWTNAAGARIGWWRPSKDPGATPRFLIFHGNAGSAAGRSYLFDPLQAGVPGSVYVLEYPGYADRVGKPSQSSFLAAADEALESLGPGGPVFLVGESLGTGVVSHLAATHPAAIAGVILLAPYDNLGAAASYHYPWLPIGLILLDRYPSDEWLPRYGGPVVAVGLKDQVVPAELGRRLYDAYPGPKRLWEFPQEGHMDVSQRPAGWWQEAVGFLRNAKHP